MPAKLPVHDRLVLSAIVLLRSQGADGFGMTELLEHSGVARRSMYQHFPAGKAELLTTAVTYAANYVGGQLERLLAEYRPVDAFARWVDEWRDTLVDTDYRYGCPLVAATQASKDYPEAAGVAAAAFDRYRSLIADAFIRTGMAPADAAVAGSVSVSALEGAIIQARASHSTAPFDALIAHARTSWDGLPEKT